jgi:hypothetical protein
VTVSVFILRGGVLHGGADGVVSSAGMDALGRQLAAIHGVTVGVYNWGQWQSVAWDMWRAPAGSKIVLIGYSGGGWCATLLADLPNKPAIDLMVVYDPSPAWQMKPIGPNVKRAICYHNQHPLMFGLGGGVLIGTTDIETVNIAEQHLAVQFDQKLHNHTIDAVRSLL